jgi:uncharacterized membrane protein (UPF0127 family)
MNYNMKNKLTILEFIKANIILLTLTILVLGLAILVVIKTFDFHFDTKNLHIITSKGSYELNVELATTPDLQEKGLMNRRTLDQDKGMLFIFEENRIQSFWMKNTYIPLDMIFFDENKNFINVAENAVPCIEKNDPCTPRYNSSKPATYVLEVNAGWAKEHGVGEGTRLSL